MTTHEYPTEGLHPHPKADLVPWPEPDDYDALLADIEANGIQVPIDAMPDGTVLDGRTRLAIARTLARQEVPVRWVEPADPVAYMLRMALRRRHLTTVQRKALAAELLRAEPQRSDRSVARTVGIDHKTVAAVRESAEGRGDIPHVAERTDTLGRQQPASKREPADEAWQGALDAERMVTAGVKPDKATAKAKVVGLPTPPRDPLKPPADATKRIARAHLLEALQSARGNADLAHPLTAEDREQVAIHLDYIRWRCLGDAPALREVSDGS